MDENSLLADLRKCRFYSGSWDSRIAFGLPSPDKMTTKQRHLFCSLLCSYRKQLGIKDKWTEAIRNRIITGQPQPSGFPEQLILWGVMEMGEKEREVKAFLESRRISEKVVATGWIAESEEGLY